MTPSVLLDEFVRHLHIERGLSVATWTSYRYQLHSYLRFLQTKEWDPASASRDDVLSYLEDRRNAGLKSASIFAAVIVIRRFHKFLLERGYTQSDPTGGMSLPKFTQRLPKPLSVAEIEKLLSLPTGTKFNRIRFRAMLETLYTTGLRVSELIGLKVNQVNLEEGWILVMGKGSKERIVPVGAKAKEALIRYIEARRNRFPLANDTLFLNSRGLSGLTRGGFWWQLRQMAKRAGISQRVSPHQIRHTFATHLLNPTS